MKHFKSERLKKLETELADLEQWLKLGLVPKRDIVKHKEEILNIKAKIDEERERLSFLKESGEGEEYITPKRTPARAGYTEMPTIPDIDAGETGLGGNGDTQFSTEMDTGTGENSLIEGKDDDEEATATEDGEEETTYFNPKRWREGIVDPDADEW